MKAGGGQELTLRQFQSMWPEWNKDPANASSSSSCHGIRDSWKKADQIMLKPLIILGGNEVDEKTLKSHGVTHVLSIISSAKAQKPAAEDADSFERLIIELEDDIDADLLSAIQEAHGFMNHATAEGICYIHCQMGRSRSAAITIAWLMHRRVRQGLAPALLHCIAVVASQRRISALNYGFFARLCDLEISLGAKESSLPLLSYFLVQLWDFPMRPLPDLEELVKENGCEVDDPDAVPRQRSVRRFLNGFNFVLFKLTDSSKTCKDTWHVLNVQNVASINS
eukprot:gnl/MRDRNA2_/MRDRNA2_70111_c0_seq1.p1 gnl/MRDRNA2_/MRDRNA2_70111_c0~~gnl/MRDRNA2_/MRDRNA2_70111_c0_seq1.p1  ORF type:complete len:281 (-),score=43.26 gnl/MRDRNA2_/MRDRNA2_70111_c0_seq1:479-1321(-)